MLIIMSYIEIYFKNSIVDVLNMNKPEEAKEFISSYVPRFKDRI